jgi:Asp/Glu/hydantoin racemase
MTARIALVNPNTSRATTEAMLAIARRVAPASVDIVGLTAPFGSSLITTEQGLAEAGRAVASLAPDIAADAVIVAAFGDPGLDELRARLAIPVTGIGEAAFLAAAGRRAAVVTTTPDLAPTIREMARRHGHADLPVVLTPGNPGDLMADPAALLTALFDACHAAVDRHHAETLIIGGGPLAEAARALRHRVPVPLIEPVPAAVDLAWRRISHRFV